MPDLDELRRLREQATPGPWRQRDVATNQVFAPFDDGLVGPGGERVVCTVNARSDEWDWRADARLIAAAVNALPGLLTEIARLRSRVEELGAKLAEAREVVRPFSETHEAAVVEAKADIWGRPVAPAKAYARAAAWLRGQEE